VSFVFHVSSFNLANQQNIDKIRLPNHGRRITSKIIIGLMIGEWAFGRMGVFGDHEKLLVVD